MGLQWQRHDRIGLGDTQIGPPICACTPMQLMLAFITISIIVMISVW
jgi:hypothetical protein